MTEMNNSTVETKKELVIKRTFKAPRELVFKAFTEAEHLANWWGPKGLSLIVSSLDVRPNGIFLYCMKTPEGHEMWGKFVYHEILAPEKITFTSSFADKDANTIRSPFSQVWPLEVFNTWTLTEDEGKTLITLTGYPINASKEEEQAFEAGHASMNQGFSGTFDQLDEYLSKI